MEATLIRWPPSGLPSSSGTKVRTPYTTPPRVHIDDPPPVLQRGPPRMAEGPDPGVVTDHVDPAERVHGSPRQRLDRTGITHGGRHPECLGAVRLQLRHGALHLGGVQVGRGHLHAGSSAALARPRPIAVAAPVSPSPRPARCRPLPPPAPRPHRPVSRDQPG